MINPLVFSLASNKRVAKSVAKLINGELGKILIDHFADGEVLVKTLSDVTQRDVVVIESTAKKAHERLFELLLLIDSIKRSGARSVKLFIPYFGYSRQERVSWINEPVSCEIVAKILDTANVDQILTFDLHHPDIKKFFKTNFVSLPTTHLFSQYFNFYLSEQKISGDKVVVVSPDHGSNERATNLTKMISGSTQVILNKIRPRPNMAEHLEVNVEAVKDKICIIVDDIIDTGGTIISAVKLLKNSGAKRVLIAASHPVFSKGSVEKIIASGVDDIVVTNSIEKPLPEQIKVLDISCLIFDNIMGKSDE